jgi:hypothetical protein
MQTDLFKPLNTSNINPIVYKYPIILLTTIKKPLFKSPVVSKHLLENNPIAPIAVEQKTKMIGFRSKQPYYKFGKTKQNSTC